MGAPIKMNRVILAKEGLQRAAIARPTPEDIDRVSRIWLPEILSQICSEMLKTGNTRMKSLERRLVFGLTKDQRSYPIPPDLEDEAVLSLYKACKRAAGPTGLRLASDPADGIKQVYIEMNGTYGPKSEEPILFDQYLGKRIFFSTTEPPRGRHVWDFELIRADFSQGQAPPDDPIPSKWLLGFDTDNRNPFPLVPADQSNSPYTPTWVAVAESPTQLEEVGWREMDHHFRGGCAGTPYYFAKMRERLEFDVPPDSDNFYVDIRYFANINRIDWSDDPFPEIFSTWRHALVPSIQSRMFLEKGDLDSYRFAKAEADAAIEAVIINEVPYGGQFEGFTLRQDGSDFGIGGW